MSKAKYFVQNDWVACEIIGPDAQDYLQRMTTVNLKNESPGFITEGTLLQATGKISLYFKLYWMEPSRFLFFTPKNYNAIEELEKFHFNEKFDILDSSKEYSLLRIFGNGTDAFKKIVLKNSMKSFHENKWTSNTWGNHFEFDQGLICKTEDTDALIQVFEKSGFEKISDPEPYRIYFGEPKSGLEIIPTLNPLDVDLDHAVHENKGCYPGQEVIEKIRAFGQSPRRLVLIQANRSDFDLIPALPIPLQSVSGDVDCGSITSLAPDPFDVTKITGLGTVKKMFATKNFIGENKFSIAGKKVNASIRNPVTQTEDDEC